MAEIFDFSKFKQMKEDSNTLENDYLEFLPWINKKLGIPTDIQSATKVLFITMRYLEGTINGFSILAMLTPMKREDIEKGKQLLIDWLNDIIENIKAI